MSTQENNIMSDTGEKISQQQEISDLKLQLNASQQIIASLELKIRQKEEIIIKTQADAIKQAHLYNSELKKLKEELNESSKVIESSSSSELEEALKAAKENESKALAELNEKIQKESKMMEILEGYEKAAADQAAEYKKLSEFHETVKGNLATLEMAFHDVIQKYERTKSLVEAYKINEETLHVNLEKAENSLIMEAQRYESLKTHARTQIEKANKDNTVLKAQCNSLEIKQGAITKRLEIKIAALENALEQKNRECEELAALCDEVTGKKV